MTNFDRVAIFASALLVLCACAGTSMVPRNVVPVDERPRKCIVAGNDRNACAQYASQRCAGGFDVFEMETPGDDGAMRRAYYYKCL